MALVGKRNDLMGADLFILMMMEDNQIWFEGHKTCDPDDRLASIVDLRWDMYRQKRLLEHDEHVDGHLCGWSGPFRVEEGVFVWDDQMRDYVLVEGIDQILPVEPDKIRPCDQDRQAVIAYNGVHTIFKCKEWEFVEAFDEDMDVTILASTEILDGVDAVFEVGSKVWADLTYTLTTMQWRKDSDEDINHQVKLHMGEAGFLDWFVEVINESRRLEAEDATCYAFTTNKSSIRLDSFDDDYEGIDLLEEGTEEEIIKSAIESGLKFIHWFDRTEDEYGNTIFNYVTTTSVS